MMTSVHRSDEWDSLLLRLEQGPVTFSRKSYHHQPGSWPTLAGFGTKGLMTLAIGAIFIVLPLIAYRQIQSGDGVTGLLIATLSGVAVGFALLAWFGHQYLRSDAKSVGETITLTQNGVLRELVRGRSLFISFTRVRRVELTGSGAVIWGRFGEQIALANSYKETEEAIEIIQLARQLRRRWRRNWPGVCEVIRKHLHRHDLEFVYGPNVFLELLRNLRNFTLGAMLLVLFVMLIIPFVTWWAGRHDVLTESSFVILVESLSTNLAYGVSALFGLLLLRALSILPGFLRWELPKRQFKGTSVVLSRSGLTVASRNNEKKAMSWKDLQAAKPEDEPNFLRFTDLATGNTLEVPWHIKKGALLFSLIHWGLKTDPPFGQAKDA